MPAPHHTTHHRYITCVVQILHAPSLHTLRYINGRPVKHWWLRIVSCLCCDAYYPGWGPHMAEGYYVHERPRPSTSTYIMWVRRHMLWTTNVVLFKRLREVMSFSHNIFGSMVAHPTYHTYIPCIYTIYTYFQLTQFLWLPSLPLNIFARSTRRHTYNPKNSYHKTFSFEVFCKRTIL